MLRKIPGVLLLYLSAVLVLAQDTPVSVAVGGMPNPSQGEVYDAFVAKMDAFMAAHPNVKVEGREGFFDRDNFAAKLAGNALETAFMVPFTDPQGLIGRGQVASVTDQLAAWQYGNDFNPGVISLFQDADGATYGLPQDGYALGLVYNRKLFEEAGLDPNTPPATWEEVREVAAQLTDASKGQSGFMQLSLDNGGGWMFTAYYYSFSGKDLVEEQDGKWVATFNDETGVAVLQMLKDMRFADGSLPERALLSYGDYTQLMASGRIGMMIYPAAVIESFATQYGADISDFGAGAMPQQGGNSVLTGGSGFMFNPKASPEELQAAFDWQLYSLYDLESYENTLKALSDQDLPVGIPVLPIFTGGLQEEREAILNKYINVPRENYASYEASLTALTLKPEPAINAQQLYASLDAAVQAVLTDENADPQALLDEAVNKYTATVLEPLNAAQ
jgi:multiple sugar transport system substrate-binding protein